MIKNAPKRIYLQVGDIPTDDVDFKDLHEVSWCEDKINDNDLCYIRAGKCYTPAVSIELRSPEDIKAQAFKYAKTRHDEESYDVKEKRAFEAGARWAFGYEKDG
jgi:hypothetical protein